MGWFGSGGDTSGSTAEKGYSESLDLSGSGGGGGDYGSKRRSPSSSEFDMDGGSSAMLGGGAGGGGDVQRVIEHEQQKLQLMTAIHKINDVCWDICVDSVGSSLGGRSETCIRNCCDRFVDTTLLITNRFAQLAQKMQGGGR